jgi:hypothetical protein
MLDEVKNEGRYKNKTELKQAIKERYNELCGADKLKWTTKAQADALRFAVEKKACDDQVHACHNPIYHLAPRSIRGRCNSLPCAT